MHGEITTTLAKAKFVRGYAEKSITIAKKNRLGARRKIASALDKESFKKLVTVIAPGFSERQGGYTRIIKMSPRTGDNAPMAKIALLAIDKSKILDSKAKDKDKNVVAKKTGKKIGKNAGKLAGKSAASQTLARKTKPKAKGTKKS